ncbi:MAG: putative baseplate assembly protein [Crocosphaera sp.]
MTPKPPNIDQRTLEDVAQEVRTLLSQYVNIDQNKKTEETDQNQGIETALTYIFSRFANIIIERLNQVPHKNFLAFLDLLGASRLPPQAARVPLTFSLAKGTTVDAVVTKGTQVAAILGEGEKKPIIFETEEELVVNAATLTALFVRDPQQDLYADYSSILDSSEPIETPIPLFRGSQPVEHIFYIAQDHLLGFPKIQTLMLRVNILTPLKVGSRILWEFWQERGEESNWKAIDVFNDSSKGLTEAGEHTLTFQNLQISPLLTLNNLNYRWFRCRLLTPILQKSPLVSEDLLELEIVNLQATINYPDLLIETGFSNQLPLDLTKDFLPFGEKPKIGDTVYFAHGQGFSQMKTRVTITVTLTNPLSDNNNQDDDVIKPVNPSENLELIWEFWNGKIWQPLGTSNRNNQGVSADNADFSDSTQALTQPEGKIEFTLFKPPVLTFVNGVESFWVRGRIIAGNYGKNASYRLKKKVRVNEEDSYEFIEADMAPPIIQKIDLNTDLVIENKQTDAILVRNETVYSEPNIRKAFKPFQPLEDKVNSLYLGLKLPENRNKFENKKISLFSEILALKVGEKKDYFSPKKSIKIGKADTIIEHKFLLINNSLNSKELAITVVENSWKTTINLPNQVTESNNEIKQTIIVNLKPQEEIKINLNVAIPDNTSLGESDKGFLRLEESTTGFFKVTQTIQSSILDYSIFETKVSSELPKEEKTEQIWKYWNGKTWKKLTVKDKTKNFSHSGLIELIPPEDFASKTEFNLSSLHWIKIERIQGDNDIEPRLKQLRLNTIMARQTITLKNEIIGSSDGSENQQFQSNRQPILEGQNLQVKEQDQWITWEPIKDFYQSQPDDRHYVLNPLTGQFTFGNGRNGLIPPPGRNNIRLTSYQTGGGTDGNKPIGSIVQLKTTVPYIDQVTNYQASTGGADAESIDSLIARVPREIRHRERAVTQEDYEDLAKIASPAVIRSKCIPLKDLSNSLTKKALNTVSVIIVPRSDEVKPLPSVELVNRVQNYLENQSQPGVNISVVGPFYVQVSITAEIAVVSLDGASDLAQRVENELNRFIHPLWGGFDGNGWNFGRQPHQSDFYRLLEGISGVDHVRSLNINPRPDPGATNRDLVLIYSGDHNISLTFIDS